MHRRTALIGLATMPLLAAATRAFAQTLTGDAIATAAGDVTVVPMSHATLILTQGAHVIYVDPAKVDFSGQPAPTAILITHEHGDHFDPDNLTKIGGTATIVAPRSVANKIPDALKAQIVVMNNGEAGTVDGLPITAVAAYNLAADKQQFHPEGRDNGYVLSFGDKKIYIAGDTEDTPEMRALSGIEVAFLPMNQPYTMTPEQAADAVKAFKPRIVYPYHYKGSDPQAFADLVGDAAEVRLRDWYKAG